MNGWIVGGALLLASFALAAQERTTSTDCRSRCDAVQKQCETQCAGNPAIPGGNCQSFCAMQVEICRQGCASPGTANEDASVWRPGEGAPTRRRKDKGEAASAAGNVGLRPLTVTLDYTMQRHARDEPRTASGSVTRAGEATSTWTMQARIQLEVPDLDYHRGLNSFSYLMGQLRSPEYLQGKGRRQRLPAAKLVTLTGQTRYAHEGRAVVKTPMAADCTEESRGSGAGTVAPAQAGDVRGASFEIAFGGGKGMVDMQSPFFVIETKTTDSCSGASAAIRRSEERIGTRQVLYAVMMANSLAGGMPPASDPACTHKLEAEAGVYRGTARCERRHEGGTQGWVEPVTETEVLSYTIEFPGK